MEIRKIFYIILSLLIYNCETDLVSPQFEIYLCSVSDVEITLFNSANLEIKWQYPNQDDQACDESVQYFVISYLLSDDILPYHPEDFSLSPLIIPFDYQSSGEYFHTLSIDDVNTNYYFTIQTQYANDYSVITQSSQGSFLFNDNFGAPDVAPTNCSQSPTSHDDDCAGFIISHSNINIDEYTDLYLNEKITDDDSGATIRTTEIALTEENMNNPLERYLFLDYMALCEIGSSYDNLYNCSELDVINGALKPNISYSVEYYYSQLINDETISSLLSGSNSLEFARTGISITNKPVSSNELRVYIENNDQMSYYNTLFIWEKLSDNTIGTVEYQIDISSNKLNNVFDEDIHVEIIDINPGEYYIGLQGPESFYVMENHASVVFNLLSVDGFRLIDRINNDFYLSTYELTQEDYSNGASSWQAQVLEMPAEVNKEDCENYINNLNTTYVSYDFRIPTNEEWEYAAGNNIYINTTNIYPWGDALYSDSANYYNSDYPFFFDNSNGASPVGYFINSPSPFGIHDMAGNLMEWVYDGSAIVGKGGNYLSFDINELQITNSQTNINETISNGMGCRILMEIN